METTKLSLLLKVLEGESDETLAHQLRLFRERALPDLDNNIRCGNSLVQQDFYDNQQMNLFSEEQHYQINAFDWKSEFREVFEGDNAGFDAIIGNPPYISFYSRESIKPLPAVERYLSNRFSNIVGGRQNTFLIFLAEALALKARQGYIGMIVPDTLTNNDSYELTRRSLIVGGLEDVARLDFPVFDGPTVQTVIPIIGPKPRNITLRRFSSKSEFVASMPTSQITVPASSILERHHCKWPFINSEIDDVLRKILQISTPLELLAETRDGINPGPKSFRQQIINPPQPSKPTWRPVIEGHHVTPFLILPTNNVVDYDPTLISVSLRRQGASFRDPQIFLAPKLVNRQTASTLIFALDDVGYCTLNSAHNTRAKDGKMETLLYLLGLLNSKVLRFYYMQQSQETRKTFPQVHIAALRKLPIRHVVRDNPHDVAKQIDIVNLVTEMLALHQQLLASKTGHDKTTIQRRISTTSKNLNRLAYALYDLTDEEIALIESTILTDND